VSLGSSAHDAVRQRELDVGIKELLGVVAQAISSLDLSDLDHVDGGETGTVTASHLLVHLLDGVVGSQGTVLLVHVGGVRAGIVTD